MCTLRSCFPLLACLGITFSLVAPTHGTGLLWEQLWDGQSSYGPSVRNSFADLELADDFELDAEVIRVAAYGGRGFGAPPNPVVTGVEVRFYGITADGKPGALQAEYTLAVGDPNLVFDPVQAGPFDITLSPPFQATGQHFLGVQVLIEGGWYRPSANRLGTRGSHFWAKDNQGSGEWEVYADVHGGHFDDLAFALYGSLAAPPVITGLSEVEATPSGRLRIFGNNLGGTQDGGKVAVGGQNAWIAEWTDSAIHAYVPEGVPAGPTEVTVSTAGGMSAPAPLTVVPREQVGRLRWRFTCDHLGIRHRPGVGPDGSVYAQDTSGLLYALSDDGGLQWILDTYGAGAEGPVVVGQDGTIYVSSNPLGQETHLHAVNPDGTFKWTFTDTGGQGIIAGPGIGPDGHVYAVFEQPGLGAVSLDAEDGSLRWSNPGSPPFNERGQLGQELAFASDRFFVGFDEWGFSNISLLYGIGLDGSQLFAVGRPHGNPQPVTDSAGNVYLQTWGSGSGIRLGGFDPDGNHQWTTFVSPTNVLLHPDVGPDDTIYTVRNLIELNAVNTDGSIRWTTTTDESLWLGPVVSPDGSQMVAAGSDLGVRAFFRAFNTADGELLWEEELATEPNGTFPAGSSRAIFSADGNSAYAGVEPLSNPDDNLHCYLYAFDTSHSEMIFRDGFEDGGMTGWSALVGAQ